jgi:uncharacterized protein (TIGR02466 family)
MEQFNITPLYAIPLYQTNLNMLDPVIKQFLVTQTYERMPSGNGDYTVNKNILNAPECTALKEHIQSHIDYFLFDQLQVSRNVTLEIQNSWVNRHGKGDYAHVHYHRNSVISGCYYLETFPDSGEIVFQKDKAFNNLFDTTVDMGFDNAMNIFNSTYWPLRPNTADLVLFPSHLAHSVTPNNTDQIRYSLAFNVFPRGQLGHGTDTIQL